MRSWTGHLSGFGGKCVGVALVLLLLLCGSSPSFAEDPLARANPIPTGSLEKLDPTQSVEVPPPTPEAVRYHHTGNRLWVVGRVVTLAIPAAWLFTGAWAGWCRFTLRTGRARKPLLAAGYFLGSWLLELPLVYYAGFLRSHAYGLSTQTGSAWLLDQLKSLGFELLLFVPVVLIVYALMRRLPKFWWLVSAALCVPGLLALAFLKPIWIDPAFNQFGPMKDQVLESRILELANRAGIQTDRVYEVDMSTKTRTVNAYVTGLFGTQRIVLWDTLLQRLDQDEVLAVMGHEIGHYVLNHVRSGILLSSILVCLGLLLLDRATRWLVHRSCGRWGFDRPDDLASLPVLMGVGLLLSLVLSPVGYAYSRHMEHEADRFTLELNQNNGAAAQAFVALHRENLGFPRPGRFVRLVRSTHPSLGDRIDFCNTYHPWTEGKPLRYAHLIKPKN